MNAQQVKDLIENRVFVPWGINVVYAPATSSSINEWGDKLQSWNMSSSSSIRVVPANAFNTKEIFYQFGNLEKGDQDILIRPTQSFEVGDLIITSNGVTASYRIKKFSAYPPMTTTPSFYYVRLNEVI